MRNPNLANILVLVVKPCIPYFLFEGLFLIEGIPLNQMDLVYPGKIGQWNLEPWLYNELGFIL